MTYYYCESKMPTIADRASSLVYSPDFVPNVHKTFAGNPSPYVLVVPITKEEYAQGLDAMRRRYGSLSPVQPAIAAE